MSISGNTAIVRHRLDARTNDGGKPGEAHLFVLLIFQKDHKQWKMLARQAGTGRIQADFSRILPTAFPITIA